MKNRTKNIILDACTIAGVLILSGCMLAFASRERTIDTPQVTSWSYKPPSQNTDERKDYVEGRITYICLNGAVCE